MPASPTGFGNFFMDRNINMPAGYQLLGCPPGVQQPPPHFVGMAGVPLPFSGVPGYSFIPYPHPGHIAHIVSILNSSHIALQFNAEKNTVNVKTDFEIFKVFV